LDIYYLGIAREKGKYASGTGSEHRHSFGARWFGEKAQWDWNAEAVVQTGDFGNESILRLARSVGQKDYAGQTVHGTKTR